jgi:hypothetical protein
MVRLLKYIVRQPYSRVLSCSTKEHLMGISPVVSLIIHLALAISA